MTDKIPEWMKIDNLLLEADKKRQDMKHAAEKFARDSKTAAKSLPRFRASGINWRVLGILALIVVAMISIFTLNTAMRSVAVLIVFVIVVALVVNAVRGRVKPGLRGWVAIGLIGLVGLAVLGTQVKMSLTLSLSDVVPKTHGWRFTMGDTVYYCDKSLDTVSYYTISASSELLMPGNTLYSRTPIPFSCSESTSQSWVMDMDAVRTGMPNIDFSTEALYPSDSGGNTIDDFVFYDYPITEDIVLVQTFVKVVVILEFTTDQPYMEIEKFILEDFFTRFEGEFYLEYVTKGTDTGSPKYTANTGGQRVVGEFAFGIETGKIKWTADEELPEAEFISTAVVGVDLVLTENSWARTSGLGGTLDNVYWANFGANGQYDVGHSGQQLLYRNTWDCLQKVDSFDSVPLSEKNYQDNFVPTVFVSIPFNVLMGGFSEYAGGSNDLTEKDEVFWISRYTSQLTFVAEIVSAYDLNIDGGITPTITNTGSPDPSPDPNPLLDLWNQISGWVIDFWKSTWYGKVILIAVPVILVSVFGGASISKAKKSGGLLGRAGGAVTQTVTVVTGSGNKIASQGTKAVKKGFRKGKGFLKKLFKKLKFWK